MGFRPTLNWFRDQEVASSNLVTPTVFQKQPFGQQVEGLSHFKYETYAVERQVQTEHFEHLTLFGGTSTHPLLFQPLRKFKRLRRKIARLVRATVAGVQLELQLRHPVS